MKAFGSLHVAVHLFVPSGVSFCCSSPCRRACSAGAFAPHFALPSAQPSNVQASCLERARPAASSHWFARSPARWLLAQQRRRAAAARSDSEGQRRKARQKDAAPGLVESQSAHGGGAARSGFPTVPLGAREDGRRTGRERVGQYG